MTNGAEKKKFQVLRSEIPLKVSFFDRFMERLAPPPSLDPREVLREYMKLPNDLRDYLQQHFNPYGVKLCEDAAKDRYTPTERPFIVAKGHQLEVILLHIPAWIVSNGSLVGTVDEIRTAFEGKVVRIISPGCDTSLPLRKMFSDWKARYRIDARLVPWSDIQQLDKGYNVADVLELEITVADAESGESEPRDASKKERSQAFISYSHVDEKWLERLKIHLKPLLKGKDLIVWEDSMIEPGDKWNPKIDQALASAKVAVLLVSKNFLASDFIEKNELPPLLEAAEKQGLRILWVLLGACAYEATKIKDYQAAHKPLVRLDKFTVDEQEEILLSISRTIVQYLEK